jgi:hypothetical protein
MGRIDPPLLPGLTVEHHVFDDMPAAARPFSQDRFDVVEIVRNPIWLGEGVHRVELGERDEPFAWLSELARLHVPGHAETLVLHVQIDAGQVPQRVIARVAGATRLDVRFHDPGLHRVAIELAGCAEHCVVELELPLAKPPPDDSRRLSMRLRAAWVEGEGFASGRRTFSPGLPGSLLAGDVSLEGFHAPDRFMGGRRPGAWTKGRARLSYPGRPGWLRLSVARPAHLRGPVHVSSGADSVAVEPRALPTDVWLRVAAPDGTIRVDIQAPAFVPRERTRESSDGRELALIVLEAEHVPGDRPPSWPPRPP